MGTGATAVGFGFYKVNGFLARHLNRFLESLPKKRDRAKETDFYESLQLEMAEREVLGHVVRVKEGEEWCWREFHIVEVGRGVLKNGICFVMVGVCGMAEKREIIHVRPETKLWIKGRP